MRVSAKGRYGLRAMCELARSFGEGPLRMSAIAERQGLSRKHLHALLTSLKSAGLVRSIRGPRGGFVLTRVPSKIRLSEVLHALEGPLSLVHCVQDGRACDRANRCAARNVWQKLSSAIEDVLDGVTLQDLVGQEAKAHSKLGGKKKARGTSTRAAPAVKRSGATSRRPGTKAGKE
ncbi:MAG: RrF2 family transcriptional regulator [Sedimentisphaerales bacterium]|nr:RrF2 family transcriptional regulator [Sedimentisphaerales bacterium]